MNVPVQLGQQAFEAQKGPREEIKFDPGTRLQFMELTDLKKIVLHTVPTLRPSEVEKWVLQYKTFEPTTSIKDLLATLSKRFAAPDLLQKGKRVDLLVAEAKLDGERVEQERMDRRIPTDFDTYEECAICMESYLLEDIMYCPMKHVTCRFCFFYYLSQTKTMTSLQCIPCIQDQCDCLYHINTIEALTPPATFALLQHRNEEQNRAAALTGLGIVANLNCNCGIIGVVLKVDVLEASTVSCLCGLSYCIKCGGLCHPGEECPPEPPSGEILEWLQTHEAKLCPDCGTGIERNGGCMHFTCLCGANFCWQCLKQWKTCDCDQFPAGWNSHA